MLPLIPASATLAHSVSSVQRVLCPIFCEFTCRCLRKTLLKLGRAASTPQLLQSHYNHYNVTTTTVKCALPMLLLIDADSCYGQAFGSNMAAPASCYELRLHSMRLEMGILGEGAALFRGERPIEPTSEKGVATMVSA